MKITTLAFLVLIPLVCSVDVFAQVQPGISKEKSDLIYQFRKATGADHVNVGFNITFEDVKRELLATVENDNALNDVQKRELRAEASNADDRLDKQLKDYLNEPSNTSPIMESAITQHYDRTFSENELRELITFYNTATGKKGLQFLLSLNDEVKKSYQAMVLPKITEFVKPKINEEYKLLNEKIAQAKSKKP